MLPAVIAKLQAVVPVKETVVNPNYDSNLGYIPRSKRPGWCVVGMLGQIYVRGRWFVYCKWEM